jgi:hypothetical protein
MKRLALGLLVLASCATPSGDRATTRAVVSAIDVLSAAPERLALTAHFKVRRARANQTVQATLQLTLEDAPLAAVVAVAQPGAAADEWTVPLELHFDHLPTRAVRLVQQGKPVRARVVGTLTFTAPDEVLVVDVDGERPIVLGTQAVPVEVPDPSAL